MPRLALLAALLAAPLAACESPTEPELRGTVEAIYPLDFVDTRARLDRDGLSIEYHAGDGQIPVQLIVRRPPSGPDVIDLADDGDVIGRRDGRVLPARKSGELVLLDYAPEDGARVAGTFSAVLTTGDRNYGLAGAFDTTLTDARAQK
ncbi:MAG: hypothetical protein H6703_06715 [Myxococcales bacterium]|nr:hypothetical protein [Myxococcales bacterium]